jgi:cleavage and polyadenylation specificity factor subunit 1
LTAGVDGSISTLIAVPEQTYKRLALLQGQLLRSIQQVSGLNPRAFRYVSHPPALLERDLPLILPYRLLPRPLSKGILDGDLLYSTFELLPRPVQEMITKQIGTSVDEVLDDLEELRAVW